MQAWKDSDRMYDSLTFYVQCHDVNSPWLVKMLVMTAVTPPTTLESHFVNSPHQNDLTYAVCIVDVGGEPGSLSTRCWALHIKLKKEFWFTLVIVGNGSTDW
jgi:hypothetical protein